jgi:glycine/D-amino acid oxidase-like deaminating enzyme
MTGKKTKVCGGNEIDVDPCLVYTGKMGHAFVLGSGISGISIAEILVRHGWSVTILEKSPLIGGDASRNTQNWLHTGWLYAGLPSESAMLGCGKAMKLYSEYRSVLGTKIVNLVANDCGMEIQESPVGWFEDERIQYVYAIRTNELPIGTSFLWRQYVENVIFKRLASMKYEIERVQFVNHELLELMDLWEGQSRSGSKYEVIRSTDARINTRRVMSDIVTMMGDRVSIVANAVYDVESSNDKTSIILDGQKIVPELVVMASGSGLESMLSKIGCLDSSQFKSVQSPIVVLDKALPLPSFIRYTPVLEYTINHIKYKMMSEDGTSCVERSTVGSYDFFPVGRAPDIEPFVEKVCSRLGIQTSSVVGSYYGTKTEMSGSMARKYNHAVGLANKNTVYAIAGKFSQFPLLVENFVDLIGLDRSVRFEPQPRSKKYLVAETVPEKIVRTRSM